MNPTKAILPYATDAEFLEAEFNWLVARAARISLVHRLEQESGHGAIAAQRMWPIDKTQIAEYRERVGVSEAIEMGVREEIDSRRSVHRATEGACKLGVDRVCDEHDLADDERLVLLIVTIVSCGSLYAEAITDALSGSHHYSLTIDDVITLLDPHDLGGWAKARLLFHREAPLLVHGLIEVETHPQVPTTTDLLDCRVSITHRAFATITGVPELAEVEWATEPTPETTPAT